MPKVRGQDQETENRLKFIETSYSYLNGDLIQKLKGKSKRAKSRHEPQERLDETRTCFGSVRLVGRESVRVRGACCPISYYLGKSRKDGE